MEKKLRVAVLFGGRSGEHEVSLRSARSVLNTLDPLKYEVIQVGITHGGCWLTGDRVLEKMIASDTQGLVSAVMLPDPTLPGLYTFQPGQALSVATPLDVIFPVLHGTFGEDGALQGLLEMADVAYVGAGVLGSAVGMDKGLFKDVMLANHIPVLETLVITRTQLEADLQQVMADTEQGLPYPIFVKPANLGSSVGITKCHSRSDLVEGLLEAARYDRRVLAQRGIRAREIEVSVLGNAQPQASLPGEIIPSREFYSYEAKYIDGNSALLIPAPIPAETAELARQLAVRAYQVTDCAGMARVDFLLDQDTGALYLNELNTIPGFTEISMYSKLWEASGISYSQLVDRLIELALARKSERDHTERRYSAAVQSRRENGL